MVNKKTKQDNEFYKFADIVQSCGILFLYLFSFVVGLIGTFRFDLMQITLAVAAYFIASITDLRLKTNIILRKLNNVK